MGNFIEEFFNKKEITTKKFEYLKNDKIDNLLFDIFINFKEITNTKNKKFYIVFNSLNPDILYPFNEEGKTLHDLLLKKKLVKIKLFLKNENIPFFDFNEYLLKNYNKKSISKMFKRIDGHWDHYTEDGFFKLTEQIKYQLLK